MINDGGRTPIRSSGSLCKLQTSLSLWWPTTQQKILKHNSIHVQHNSLHDLLQLAGHTYTPKAKCLISDFIDLKMDVLKIRLWQVWSVKHSSENSYWQPSTQARKSNMDTKLCNFFCQSRNDIYSLILTNTNFVQYGSCEIWSKRCKKTCNFCVSLVSAMNTSAQASEGTEQRYFSTDKIKTITWHPLSQQNKKQK